MRTKFSSNKSIGIKAVNASPIGDGIEPARPKGGMKPSFARGRGLK